jgi:hypothetical protein
MQISTNYDERVEEIASGRQLEYYKAYCEHGSVRAASKELDCGRSSIRNGLAILEKKIVAAGLLPSCSDKGVVGAGRSIGKVTTHIKDGEVKQEWIRTDTSAEDVLANIMEAVKILSSDVKGKSTIVKAPALVTKDLVSVYPLFDKHYGMMAWAKEGGDDYDLDIAVEQETAIFDRLVASQPCSKEALIVFGGDYFHADDDNQVTPGHHNKLDVDGRSFKVFGTGILMAKRYIEKALSKHKNVTVEIIQGNHDPVLSMALLHVLDSYYENNKRVTVKAKPGRFSYYEFGSTLLAFQHGDKMKQERMYQVVTTDMREAWGRVKYCHVFTGHFHRERTIDVGLCKMESLRTTIPNEAYSTEAGYRSPRTAYAITFSCTGGEVGRTMQNI